MYMYILYFQITMPSGAYVKIYNGGWYFNGYVYVTSEDKNKLAGLCGDFDGNILNDLTGKNPANPGTSFLESWRFSEFVFYFKMYNLI